MQAAARVTGILARTINFWTGPARVLKPDHAYRGRGSAKRFSLRNLVQLRVIALLAQRGVALASIRELIAQAEHQRGFGEDWFALPVPAAAGARAHPREFLTYAQPGGWARWYFPPEALGFMERLEQGPRHRKRRPARTEPLVLPVAWPRRATSLGSVPLPRDGKQGLRRAFLLALLGGEDVVLVNLGRIKAALATRLGREL